MTFMGKIRCKKYPKKVWNSMPKEQQTQVPKLHEQQSIKPTMKMTSANARIAALEAKLGINSQPKEGDSKKKQGESLEEPALGINRRNPAVTC